ncbi:MAG: Gfo/Idh/MocA family protein [Candidatus Zipacnadales bacterium]
MIKLGLVGGVDIFHGIAFSALLNEYDEEAWTQAGYWKPGLPPLEKATITAIWDPEPGVAQRRAEILEGVELVCEEMTEMIGQVDGVLIADDVTQQHQKRARVFLEAGVPTFCDKPLSRDPVEAAEIVALARNKRTKFMSSSALRFARELEEAQEQLAAIQPLRTVYSYGPNELIFYGIHACELAHTVLGPGAESVRHVGDANGHNIVRVRWADGRYLVLQVFEDMAGGFGALFHGAKGHYYVQVSDAAYFYQNMLKAFIRLIETGEEAVPPENTLEIIRILAAAEKSMHEGCEVAVVP